MTTKPAVGVPLNYTSTHFRLFQRQGIGKAHLKMNSKPVADQSTFFCYIGPFSFRSFIWISQNYFRPLLCTSCSTAIPQAHIRPCAGHIQYQHLLL